MFEGIKLFFRRLRLFPHFLICVGVDMFKWIKGRRWQVFEGWGLHIYLGAFGQGKPVAWFVTLMHSVASIRNCRF